MVSAMEKDSIKGFNISSELVLLNINGFEDFFVSVSPLLHALKKNKINTPFLSTSFSDKEKAAVSCCFAIEDMDQVKALIQENKCLKRNSSFIPGVGLLSVFPHRSSLGVLGFSFSALGQANLSVLGMSSSISSLIFVLPYDQLTKAVDSLKGCFFPTEGIH
jgi:aspartokinase